MPANKDFYLRIGIIDECLRNRLKKWTLEELVVAVNLRLEDQYGKSASKRTIQADLNHIIHQEGAPVERKRTGTVTHFSYSDPTFSIKNLPIQEEEISLLQDAINILRQVSDFKVLTDVDNIITKLQNTVRMNSTGTSAVIQFERHTVAGGTQHIDNIFTAIKEKSPLRIGYQSFRSSVPKEHLFHPYLLKEYRNRWFLIGRTHSSLASLTNLALDRIHWIKNCRREFVPNNLFDPNTYYHHLIGVTMPDNRAVTHVEIKCMPDQAPFIRTKPIHHTQNIIKVYKNGSLLIRLQIIINFELKATLLGYGNSIEVITPVELREDLKKTFIKGVMNYNKK